MPPKKRTPVQNIPCLNIELIVLLDRSGSMQSIKLQMEEALSGFMHDQKCSSGKCNVTLIQFNTTSEVVYTSKNIHLIEPIKIHPYDGTALYDAQAKAIILTEKRISELNKSDKPDKVIFVTITDGEENASREFNSAAVSRLVKTSEEKGWIFYYLGANQNAEKVAKNIGINLENVVSYDTSSQGIGVMASTLSNDILRTRLNAGGASATRGVSLQAVYNSNRNKK